ncbi:SLATT domain-containing protein [Streptomyces sp. NPDC001260]|uniref:SLATT domain-containing protein n=1 Tax=Streptomyces sp. NPDC001260 TaxID=3364551 RepID=UPI0036BDC24A
MGVDPQPPAGLPPSELARWVQGQLTTWIEWSRSHRRRFRRSASLVKSLSFALSVTSTVVLGLQDLNFWASLAFSLGAAGAAIGAVEPFFSWRARWVLLEEAEASLHRIRDELDYLIARTAVDVLSFEDVDAHFRRAQEVWAETTHRWLDQRHVGQRDT